MRWISTRGLTTSKSAASISYPIPSSECDAFFFRRSFDMAAIKETAELLWRGELTTRQQHPFTATGELEEIAPNVAFGRWLANFVVCKTNEGLVLIDTGACARQEQMLTLVRAYSTARIHTVIYTHGHLDHTGAMAHIAAEAAHNRVARPRVVGHRGITGRFDRYK